MKRYNRRERVNHLHKQKIQQENFNRNVENVLSCHAEDIKGLQSNVTSVLMDMQRNTNTIIHHRKMFNGIGQMLIEFGQGIQLDTYTEQDKDGYPLVPKDMY